MREVIRIWSLPFHKHGEKLSKLQLIKRNIAVGKIKSQSCDVCDQLDIGSKIEFFDIKNKNHIPTMVSTLEIKKDINVF
jgi:hypothetical protein